MENNGVNDDSVIKWYEDKTDSIINKYGPGPIIHFHTGLINHHIVPSQDNQSLKIHLVNSQQRLLDHAYKLWRLSDLGYIRLLDVGCGLGGGAIYLAKMFGVKVYALTNVPSHLNYIQKYVDEAGVKDRVIPLLGDACDVPGGVIFDSAIAVESSCYLDRYRWFKHLATRIRHKGHIYIVDSFSDFDEVKKQFNEYWLTQLGSLNEYHKAANQFGFNLESEIDISKETEKFWELSVLYSNRILETQDVSQKELIRLKKSIDWQTRLWNLWRTKKITCSLLDYCLQ